MEKPLTATEIQRSFTREGLVERYGEEYVRGLEHSHYMVLRSIYTPIISRLIEPLISGECSKSEKQH